MDQQRQPAAKVFLREVIEGELLQDPEQGLFLYTKIGEKLGRVNLLGAILHKEKIGSISNVLVDDGTAKIVVRFFEENSALNGLEVGSPVVVIGKVREYNGERYISPDLIRGISPLWLKARRLELLAEKKDRLQENTLEQKIKLNKKEANNIELRKEEEPKSKSAESKITASPRPSENTTPESAEIETEEIEGTTELPETVGLPFQRILGIIKELDEGDGARIDDIIEKSPLKETEDLLQKMLEKGEIFQITSGKVKVL